MQCTQLNLSKDIWIGFSFRHDFLDPFNIVNNIHVAKRDLQTGIWVPTGFSAHNVLVKRICGEQIGLVLGSENNQDPLAGLLVRQFPDLSVMRAIRLWNDTPVNKRTEPEKLRPIDRFSRVPITKIVDLIHYEQDILARVRSLYWDIVNQCTHELVVWLAQALSCKRYWIWSIPTPLWQISMLTWPIAHHTVVLGFDKICSRRILSFYCYF